MEKNKLAVLGIVSRIEGELQNIKEFKSELDSIRDKKGLIYKRSRGSVLHDFYNCCERVFKEIAVELNQGYEESERWHKNLLRRMTIPIKGIRPQVISEELATDLDEYLAFRYLFRSIYGFELKGDRIDRLAERFEWVSERFVQEIEKFMRHLQESL